MELEILEISDAVTCDPQVWFVDGDHPEDHFLAALDIQRPRWRRDYARLTFTSEQTSHNTPAVQRGYMKRSFGRFCEARAGEAGAFPVTFIRLK